MSHAGVSSRGILEQLHEFDKVAGLLEMPTPERLAILNVSEDAYGALQSRTNGSDAFVKPELERRLSYALPLMRKLAHNAPVVRLPTRAARRFSAPSKQPLPSAPAAQ